MRFRFLLQTLIFVVMPVFLMAFVPEAPPDTAQVRVKLRSHPLDSLSGEEVKHMIKERGFYAGFFNPSGRGLTHQYETETINGDKVVIDHTTGLMWQQSGSSRGTYKKAQAYINQLNREKFAGFNDWRLPTLEEAMSLMEPTRKNGNLYIDPVFDETQRWTWTVDRHSASAAWYVSFTLGFCGINVIGIDTNYVRAVRSG